MNELISVIVPAYNAEAWIEKCVYSILNQTYPNVEIILIDDGSTDCTWKVAEQLREIYPDRIMCIHQPNSGVSKARFIGIQAARGEWIGFVDSDDLIDSDMYERLLSNAVKYDADISHCGYRSIVNGGERIHYFYNTGRVVLQSRLQALKDLISGSFIEPSLCTKLFHKSLLPGLMHSVEMDTSIKYTEDLLLNYVLFREAKKAIYEDFCPYQYIVNRASATRKKANDTVRMRRILDPVQVRRIIYESAEDELKSLCEEKLLSAEMRAYITLLDMPGQKEITRELKQDMKARKTAWKRLGKKEYLRMVMIVRIPHIYRFLFSVYVKYFQKKIYE